MLYKEGSVEEGATAESSIEGGAMWRVVLRSVL